MNELLKYFRIVAQTYREIGFRRSLQLALRFIYTEYTLNIYTKDLRNLPKKVECKYSNLIKKGDVDYLKRVRRNIKMPTWELYCDIYDKVGDFFIAILEGEIIHISWIYYNNKKRDVVHLGEKEAEIKNCSTHPMFRGMKIYPAVLTCIQEYLRTKGYTRVYMRTNEKNRPSAKGIESAGFSLFGKIKIIIILGIHIKGPFILLGTTKVTE